MSEQHIQQVQQMLDHAARQGSDGHRFGRITALQSVSGGCINRTERVTTDLGVFFLKTLNDPDAEQRFAAEAAGLVALGASIRVPAPLAWGSVAGSGYLLLEWLELAGRGNDALLGEQLAAQHAVAQPYFGFASDNFIGTMPQQNASSMDWQAFYGQSRLRPQLDWAAARGLSRRGIDLGHRLIAALPMFFADYDPAPALIHGDLWGGNYGFDPTGAPVLYDPAVYFADREAELAMTELFGGFSPRFYDAYWACSPLDPGYSTRKTLYNLYHVLNHFNLFGGGYGAQAASMMDRLLTEIGA